MRASTPELVRVAIIGGGLCGLTTAYELIRRARLDALPVEIRLYEAEGRFGGKILTESGEGFVLEHGASSFSTANVAVLKLAVELGLRDELIAAHVERGLTIWWDGSLHPVPPGLLHWGGRRRALLSSSLFGVRSKLRIGAERLVPRRIGRSDESISSFVGRRYGRQMLDRVADPLLAGTFLGDPEALSIQWTFPELVDMERRNGSVDKGLSRYRALAGTSNGSGAFPGVPLKLTRSPVLSFRRGMQTLIDALAVDISKNDTEALHLSSKVTGLRPAGDPLGAAAYAVDIADGEGWIADLCVLALPGTVSAGLVGDFAPEVADELNAVPHASSVSVHLGYDRAALKGVAETTGCVVPHSEGRPSIACTLVHAQFDYRAPPQAALVHLQLGGERKPDMLDWDNSAARRVARGEVETLFGIRADPLFAEVRRHPRQHPQYLVGHADHVAAVERELEHHSGLLVCGSALYGARVADVIENGRATAGTIADLARTRLA